MYWNRTLYLVQDIPSAVAVVAASLEPAVVELLAVVVVVAAAAPYVEMKIEVDHNFLQDLVLFLYHMDKNLVFVDLVKDYDQ